MEKGDSFAIVDINIGDKDMAKSTRKGNMNDENMKNNKSQFSTVFKIRKLHVYLRFRTCL